MMGSVLRSQILGRTGNSSVRRQPCWECLESHWDPTWNGGLIQRKALWRGHRAHNPELGNSQKVCQSLCPHLGLRRNAVLSLSRLQGSRLNAFEITQKTILQMLLNGNCTEGGDFLCVALILLHYNWILLLLNQVHSHPQACPHLHTSSSWTWDKPFSCSFFFQHGKRGGQNCWF